MLLEKEVRFMVTREANVVDRDGNVYLELSLSDRTVSISLTEDNPNAVKEVFNQLILALKKEAFKFRLTNEENTLYYFICKEYINQLNSELASVSVFATHSRDLKRDEQRELFGKTVPSVMVTTSVLERGITVPKADVIVLYAHDDLYDARTLIQMAGRSGRAASHPTGSVYFIAAANTKSIQWAVDRLEEINADARQRGLLLQNQKLETSNIEESEPL